MRVQVGIAVMCLLVVFVLGCADNSYVDQDLKIEVLRLDSDLENRWSTNGVIVNTIQSGSPAQGELNEGELITHVVGKFDAQKDSNVAKALKHALDEDRSAVLILEDGRQFEIGLRKRGEDLGVKFQGAQVESVEPGKAAALAGLKVGDEILAVVDEKRITNIEDYKEAMKEIKKYASAVTFYTNELSVIKLAAIQALGSLGDPRALDPLIEMLQSNEIELRQPAAQALELLSDQVKSPKLTEVMIEHLKDSDAEIRRSSASVLGKLRVEAAIHDLVGTLEDPIPGVRYKAGVALSQIGSPALGELIQVLKTGSPSAKEIAVSSLGDIGGSEALTELLNLLNQTENVNLQLWVVDSLDKMARRDNPQALEALQQVSQEATNAGVQVVVGELLSKLQKNGS